MTTHDMQLAYLRDRIAELEIINERYESTPCDDAARVAFDLLRSYRLRLAQLSGVRVYGAEPPRCARSGWVVVAYRPQPDGPAWVVPLARFSCRSAADAYAAELTAENA